MVFINNKPRFYIGVDPHKFIHTICIINNDNEKLLTFSFENIPACYEQALSKIIKFTKCKDIIFGLEDITSSGFLFAYYLNDLGYQVKQVNPALPSVYRTTLPNYHKSDEYDAYCVARVIKDIYPKLPDFHFELVYSDIKLLTNIRNQLTKQQTSDYISLHVQLAKVYPGYTKFFCKIQIMSALIFFKNFPSSRHLKGYNAMMLSEQMKEHIVKEGRRSRFELERSQKILDIVRSNPIPFENIIVEEIIIELVNDIFIKEARITSIDKKLENLIAQTGYRLQTMPGISTAIAARIISEIGDINRFKSESQLANFAGIAPISVGSGGKHKEYSSNGGNRALRATIYFLAVGLISFTNDKKPRYKIYREYYEKKLAQGKTKKQAVISVMRKVLRIIYVMMKNKSEWIEPGSKDEEVIN